MPRRKHLTRLELIKLQKTCETDAAIGAKFGISRQAVHQWRVNLGLPSVKEKNKQRDEKISGLYKSLTGIEIAKRVGLSVSQVYRIIKQHEK